MDLLTKLSPEQLKALSPEQIREIMTTNHDSKHDINKLNKFINDAVFYRNGAYTSFNDNGGVVSHYYKGYGFYDNENNSIITGTNDKAVTLVDKLTKIISRISCDVYVTFRPCKLNKSMQTPIKPYNNMDSNDISHLIKLNKNMYYCAAFTLCTKNDIIDKYNVDPDDYVITEDGIQDATAESIVDDFIFQNSTYCYEIPRAVGINVTLYTFPPNIKFIDMFKIRDYMSSIKRI